jgi:hypothetical protein
MDVIVFASYASRSADIYRPVGICRLSGIYRPVDTFLPLWIIAILPQPLSMV